MRAHEQPGSKDTDAPFDQRIDAFGQNGRSRHRCDVFVSGDESQRQADFLRNSGCSPIGYQLGRVPISQKATRSLGIED